MGTSDKRRSGGGSASQALRSSYSSNSNNNNNNSGGGGGGGGGSGSGGSGGVIAPPPRVQLGTTTPSPSAETEGAASRAHFDSDRASIASSMSKDHAARDREGQQQQLLRDRDDKIAELQRELVALEAEFARQVEVLSQNESETAAFWQAKHSGLNQQFLRTDTELRLLRAEVDVRDGERQELKEGWAILKRELRERDDDIRRLHSLNRGLKEQVSTNTRTYEQTSDDQFGDDMSKLANGLQNWVIMHFRKAKLDVPAASEAIQREISELVPMYRDLASAAKVHLLQSMAAHIMVDSIFGVYFVGLPEEQARQLVAMERYLSSLSSDEAANQWRATTLNMIRKDAVHKLQAETDAVVEGAIARANRLFDAITDVCATDARDQALRTLATAAVALARLLSVQKAVFKVTMPQILPHQKTMFDASEMEDIGGEDEDNLAGRDICCVTFPSIIKFGDERGGHAQLRNVIAKARVLLRPE